MEFSLNLLKRFVDLSQTNIDDLIKRLTFSGFEVEGVREIKEIDGLVIAKVISCKDHPDSDHLHVLKVDTGPYKGILDIVCGAPNVKEGIKVILATVGTKLDAITIKESIIRGQASCGMCCSLKELSIDDSNYSEEIKNGIYVIDDSVEIGQTNVFEVLNFKDVYLDINVLPNRPDCFSYYGIAREISSLLGLKLLIKEPKKIILTKNNTINISSSTDKCQRFSFVTLKTKNMSSPKELVDDLLKLNIKPINFLVDLGNYVMKLTGQPLHIYDLNKIDDHSKILVKLSNKEKFTALNSNEYEIDNDLVVTFGKDEKVYCLAGVMGSKDCTVEESSTYVGIEAASFFHQNVRLTSKRLNLISDSSILFTKKVNPYLTLQAIELYISLLQKFGVKYKVQEVIDFNKLSKKTNLVSFSLRKLNSRLGTNYSLEDIKQIFDNYNIKIHTRSLEVPNYRPDLIEQCDIEEEVFRYFQGIGPFKSLEALPTSSSDLNKELENENKIITRLTNLGLTQIISFTLQSKDQTKLFNFNSGQNENYVIKNPMTNEREYVRKDLIPSMIETLDYNFKRKNTNLALFEISQLDIPGKVEKRMSIGLCGRQYLYQRKEAKLYDFYDLKNYVYEVLDIYSIQESRIKLVPSTNSFFHKNVSADLFVDNKLIASFGKVSPVLKDLNNKYLFAEINLSLLNKVVTNLMKAQAISNYPKVTRDFSFVLDKTVLYKDIEQTIKKTLGKFVSDVNLFDYFELDTGEVSVGIKVNLVNFERTFDDKELTDLHNKVIEACKTKFNAKVRGLDNV